MTFICNAVLFSSGINDYKIDSAQSITIKNTGYWVHRWMQEINELKPLWILLL